MLYRKILGSLIVLGAVAFAGSAQAALIHESFSQTAGGLGGQAGGEGLSGNWSVNQTVNVVGTPTLSYGSLPNGGGQATLSNGNGVDAWVNTSSSGSPVSKYSATSFRVISSWLGDTLVPVESY